MTEIQLHGAEPDLKEANGLRILVVRPDRLGDVVLSTPVFEAIKRHYPRSHLTVMTRAMVAPLIKGIPFVDEILIYDPDKRHRGLKGFFRLVREIRRRGFRIAVVLQSHWKIAAAITLAQVRYRIAPLSKVHSYLFYNRGVRQHRSQVEMHEADYNLALLRRMGIRTKARQLGTHIAFSEEVREQARKWLEEKGWSAARPFVVVHPGMGGSALNWPEEHYIELVRELVTEGTAVLVTGGAAERALGARIAEKLGADAKRAWFYIAEKEGVDFLAALYSWAAVIVAPSTGPLHVAVALGKPVVTFYPPIRVQSALRWGPYGSDDSQFSVMVPEVYCGQDFKCRLQLCNYFPCMKSLSVVEALDHVHQHLRQPEQTK